MTPQNKLSIGISLGDPAGIGPEVTVKALRKISPGIKINYTVVGLNETFDKYSFHRLKNCNLIELPAKPANKIRIGRPNLSSADAALTSINTLIKLLKRKHIQALVTAPVAKEHICRLGIDFKGHTEYIAQAFHIKRFGMMFVADNLRTILVTRHIPLQKVSRAITIQQIWDTIELTNHTLKKIFHIKNPVLGICGLNPHAGEGGLLGSEEKSKIIPAILKAQKRKIRIKGPLSADTLFYPQFSRNFDAIIAMYHDQGLVGVKALYFQKLVNLTVGLPFIRTSPAHGTAFDIAGKNLADATSMHEAVKLAIQLSLK